MVTVNAMGDKCPLPVIKTKKALDALTAPETIEVLVDNETAVATRNQCRTNRKLEAEFHPPQQWLRLAEGEYERATGKTNSC